MTDLPSTPDPDGPGGQEILAIVLDKPSRASELLLALTNLGREGKVTMHDAVIVAKDDNGHARIVETVDVTPLRGAISGTWWGMLAGLLVGGPVFLGAAIGGAAAGALYGKLVDKGLEDGWVKDMAAWIDPSTSGAAAARGVGVRPRGHRGAQALRGDRTGGGHHAARGRQGRGRSGPGTDVLSDQ